MTDPTLNFVLVDLTTDATPAALKPAQAFDVIIPALLEQVVQHYAPYHGAPCIAFRVASSPTDRQPNELGTNFRDTIPEASGALAYHTVINGVPDMEFGVDLFSALTDGDDPLSGGWSHELLELLRDIGANGWKDKQDGSGMTGAEEVADPVQNTFYNASNGVALSNFVLPAYFIPGAPGPYDYMGVMAAATNAEIAKYGYEVQATAPTSTVQVGGDEAPHTPRTGEAVLLPRRVFLHGAEKLTDKQRRRKAHPWSRTYRRGVRL